MMLKRKTHFLNIAFNHIDQIAKIRAVDNRSLDQAAKNIKIIEHIGCIMILGNNVLEK